MSEYEEVVKQLKELAGAYVPEWKFEEENGDIGTALALVYGEMAASVRSRFEHIMEKKQIDFLNAAGAQLQPATPGRGYVSFGLPEDMEVETKVSAHTVLSAECKEAENGQITYETLDDLLVTPAKLSCIYEVSEQEDYIGKCYERTENRQVNTRLFQHSVPDMQKHELYLGHPEVFDVSGETWFTVSFYSHTKLLVREDILKQLLDSRNAEIGYTTEEGFVPFEKKGLEQGKLLLQLGAGQPAFKQVKIGEQTNYWICIQVKQMKLLQYLSFDRVSVGAKENPVLPDMVIADGMEADLHSYLPFGERLSVFSEVYFISDKVLGKHGANIDLSFHLSFLSIPLETNTEEEEIKWEWVMEPEAFERQKEYDVTIAAVTWEYYNGTGWVRIYPDKTNETVFSPLDAGSSERFVKISFVCPQDIQQAYVDPGSGYTIRAKITKLNNPYKLTGRYISPVIQNTAISFDYKEHPVENITVTAFNNLSYTQFRGVAFRPFVPVNGEGDCLYLGFTKPLKRGPIKLYIQLRETFNLSEANLVWEYWNGKRFELLRVIDETLNFSRSGLITFLGADEFEQTAFFGESLYWLRISDVNHYYADKSQSKPVPYLKDIILNTVKVQNQEPTQTEYFQMEYFVRGKVLRLQKNHVLSAKVYVRNPVIGTKEQEWKEWTQVPDFLNSGEQSEHFWLDQNEGLIQFGDGISGRIPPVSREENIKVEYSCGGGLITNVDAGQITKLNRSVGFINQVSNTEPVTGGLDQEEKEEAIKRCSNQLRMRNRAVTLRDYETLAYEASRRIHKAKCFSGVNGNGEKEPGAITLVLLLKDYKQESIVFHGIRNTVESYLKERMPAEIYNRGKLYIVEPVFIVFHVKAVILVKDFQYVFSVQNQVEERLTQFFDPIAGNLNQTGWEMGYLPSMLKLRNLLHLTEHVEEIQSIFITVYQAGSNGLEEVELEDVKDCPFVLPMNGTHQISIQY